MHINTFKFSDGSFVDAYIENNIDNVIPLEYLRREFIIMKMHDLKSHFHSNYPDYAKLIPNRFYLKKANESWCNNYDEIYNTKLSKNFISLLFSKSKREQEKLLKNEKLTTYGLTTLAIHAYKELGFTYGSFHFETISNSLSQEKLPDFIYDDTSNNTVKTIGATSLSEGKQKNIVRQRKIIVAKFLNNTETGEWHCFFSTYRGIYGLEEGHGPHYHYISDKWGISKEQLLEGMSKGRYPATKTHIVLLG